MVDDFLRQFASKEAIERHELKKAEVRRKLDELDKMERYYKEERRMVKKQFKIQLILLVTLIGMIITTTIAFFL